MIPMLAACLLLLLATLGIAYTLAAAWLVRRFSRRPAAPGIDAEPVTILKPLHGAEPHLAANLRSFLEQEWPAPVQLVAGVGHAGDGALPALEGLAGDVVRVIAPTAGAANAKMANVANMMEAASHDLLILSDSDMVAPPAYVAQVAAALAPPDVGAVTCLYRGRGDAGIWSVLGAAQLSYNFLPSVLIGLALGRGSPCMGSTIALRRPTLDRIGGFGRFTDVLADDHAIGAAVRGLGLSIAVPSLVLAHASAERSLGELARHELRWAATVRGLDPAGYAGLVITHPLPLALLAAPFAPTAASAVATVAIVARCLLAGQVDRLAGARTSSKWLIPLRDCLSFTLFVASFFVRSVDWRGHRLKMEREGRVSATPTELRS